MKLYQEKQQIKTEFENYKTETENSQVLKISFVI